MYVEITIDDKTFVSRSNAEISAKDAADEIFKTFDKLTKFQMELKTGGILILGENDIRRMRLCIHE